MRKSRAKHTLPGKRPTTILQTIYREPGISDFSGMKCLDHETEEIWFSVRGCGLSDASLLTMIGRNSRCWTKWSVARTNEQPALNVVGTEEAVLEPSRATMLGGWVAFRQGTRFRIPLYARQ